MLQRGDFVLRVFENRIREPRIDEQNFSARCHNFESRLTVPSELRVHGNHQTEKPFGLARETPFQGVTVPAFVAVRHIRHSTFAIRHFTYDSPHEPRTRAPAHFKESPAHGAVNQTIAAI